MKSFFKIIAVGAIYLSSATAVADCKVRPYVSGGSNFARIEINEVKWEKCWHRSTNHETKMYGYSCDNGDFILVWSANNPISCEVK